MNTVFIISTGRTGTHFFSHFFNNNFKNTYCTHEPRIDLFETNIAYARKKISDNFATKLLLYSRRKIRKKLDQRGVTNYIESNNNLSYMIPIVRKVFPNYKIVHIVRDGEDIVKSLYSKTTNRRFEGRVEFLSRDDHRNRLKASFFEDDPYYAKWNNMSRFEKCCWYWSRKDAWIRKAIKNDERAKTFKFEQLFKEKDPKAWNDLIDFCGLSQDFNQTDIISYISQKRSNENKSFKLGDAKEWPTDHIASFKEIAGEHMIESGYELT